MEKLQGTPPPHDVTLRQHFVESGVSGAAEQAGTPQKVLGCD
jgi:hypothetical protein